MANLLEKLTSGLTKTRSISSAIDTLLGASDAAAARASIGVELRRYVALDPVVQEWSDVAVSAAGVLYTLSSVPNDKKCLVQLWLDTGLPTSGSTLAISIESAQGTTRTAPAGPAGAGITSPTPSLGWFWTSGALTSGGGGGMIWILTSNAQIWARRSGAYFGATLQSNLWVLGYFEGD